MTVKTIYHIIAFHICIFDFLATVRVKKWVNIIGRVVD